MNKLFLLTTTRKIDYDMYDSCVVVAKDVESARLIGVASDEIEAGSVVISSFNAG